MKIAVTGATGAIGRSLVSLLPPGDECHALGRSAERLNLVFGSYDNADLFAVDYSLDSLKPAFEGVEGVVHLAGIRPGKSVYEPELYRENLRMTINVFEVCRLLNISNVVFASSSTVYTPGVDPVPFEEDTDLFPATLYGAGKLACEKAGAAFGLCIKSLRIASAIGIGEREEYMRMAYIYRAMKKDPLYIYGDGTGEREYVYVKDVGRAILLALGKPALSTVVNIGCGTSISQQDYAELVNRVFAKGQCDIVFMPEKKGYRDMHRMSSRKARNVLGYAPAFTLEEAFEDLCVGMTG